MIPGGMPILYRSPSAEDNLGAGLARLDPCRGAALYLAPSGRMAEWLCRGLQILVQRFDSASGLHVLSSCSRCLYTGTLHPPEIWWQPGGCVMPV